MDVEIIKLWEKTLKERATFQKALLEAIPTPIFYKDREGRYLGCNSSFERFFGAKKDELTGKTVFDINPPELAAIYHAKDRELFESKGVQQYESQVKNTHGVLRDVIFHKSVFFDVKGEVCGLIGTIFDITERRDTENRLKESQRVARLGHYFLDVNCSYWKSSNELDAIFGIDESYERTVEGWLNIVHPDFRTIMSKYFREHVLSQRNNFDKEYKIVDIRTRKEKWVHGLGNIKLDENGNVIELFGTIQDITDRKLAELALLESREKLRGLFDLSPLGIALTDMQGRHLEVNKAFQAICGYPATELKELDYWALTPKEYETQELEQLESLKKTGRYGPYEKCYLRKDGRLIPVRLNGILVKDQGEQNRIWSIAEDITERKRTEKKLQLAASVFSHAREGIIITDTDGTIMDVNDAFTRITGYSREEMVGQNSSILKSGRDGQELYAVMRRGLIEKGYWNGEIWNRRKNGQVYPAVLTVSAVRDAHGRTQHYVALFTDIAAQKEHQLQLEHIAHHDALTNLPNRLLLQDRLRQSMTQAKQSRHCLAVAYLDLDGFKVINDVYGHGIGDQLLIALTQRFKEAVREGDTIARFGGDEFVAILIDLADPEDCKPILNRLLSATSLPVHIGHFVLQVSASVGVTYYPQEQELDTDQLLRQADVAMYQAKISGKNRCHHFDAKNDRNVRGQHESLERIHHALSEHEFVLHFQPKVNMRTGEILGVEALIRWQHPERGLLLPAAFFPVIEDHPISSELDRWVVNTVMAQLEKWHCVGLDITVCVNVGAHLLQHPDFVEFMREQLAAHPDIEPSLLELEVVETSALEDIAHVSHVMHACRNMGVNFTLDDFGTGYSSITYLKRLPVDQLKIDRSFVRDMLSDPDDLTILKGVLNLARAFRRRVVAEGVETAEHGDILLQLGCELGQGNGIACPMPAANIPEWFNAWRPNPAWLNQHEVSQDALWLIFTAVELRAWIKGFEEFLNNERTSPPPHQQQYRVEQSLSANVKTIYGGQPAFQLVERLHQEVLDLAADLIELHRVGRDAEAQAKLPELHELRNTLLRQLNALAKVQV